MEMKNRSVTKLKKTDLDVEVVEPLHNMILNSMKKGMPVTSTSVTKALGVSSKRRSLEALDRLEDEGLVSSSMEYVKCSGSNNIQKTRVFQLIGT